jgi:DNA-binding NarL/FixJ family response regulator
MASVKMTSREKDVIAHIATGKSNKEISRELNIAVYTVKSHVHNILEKLALHTRLELATFTLTQSESEKSGPKSSENQE